VRTEQFLTKGENVTECGGMWGLSGETVGWEDRERCSFHRCWAESGGYSHQKGDETPV